MKKKSKLWLLGAVSLASVVTPGAAILSGACTVPAWKKQQYVFEFNSTIDNQAFRYDSSRSFGSYLETSTIQHTGGEFVRLQGLTEVKTKSIVDSQGNIQIITIKPNFVRYKLELAQAIILTDESNNVHVFDSDETDGTRPEAESTATDGTKYYKESTVKLTSSNEKSINSAKFREILAKAKKFQVVIKKGINWVDSNGQKTKYQLVARDYWYSWLRTVSLNESYRHANGGSKELDEKFKLLGGKNTTAFTDVEDFQNEYLYGLFGIDSSKFYKENEFIQKVGGASQYKEDQALTFEKATGSAKAEFASFFAKLFSGNDYTFMPAPSQFIDELNESGNPIIANNLGEDVSASLRKEFIDELAKIGKDKIQYFTGAYWYGVSPRTLLHVGPYYLESAKNQKVTLRKNQHYWDKTWTEAKDTINTIIFQHQSAAMDAKLFTDTMFNKFEQGTLSQLAYQSLSETQKQRVSKNPGKYGLRLAKTLNTKSPFYRMFTTPWVASGNANYGFNDAYAKLMWDATVEEIRKGEMNADSYVSGLGLSFRSILNAAINWDTYAGIISSNQSEAWVAKIANGSEISGSNQSTSSIKTPEDVKDQINALSAIGVDGKKIDFGGTLGKELSPSENADAIKNKSSTADKLKSAGFNKLKEEIAKVIEKFDQENPTLKNQNFKIQYFFPFVNAPDLYINGWKEIAKVVEELNPRIKLTVKYFTNGDDKEFDNWRFNALNGEQNLAWSYDYDGIGSGFDGLSWGGLLIPTLVKISKISSQDFKDSFPELSKLAQELIDYEKTNKTVFSVPFEKLDLVSTKWMNRNFSAIISGYKLEEKNGKYEAATQEIEVDGKKKTVLVRFQPESGKSATDPYEWSGKFWLYYNKAHTNEDLAKLIQEFASFTNINFTYGITKSKSPYAKKLVNNHYVTPDITGYEYTQYVDWRITGLKK
ncbi:OppA family ABC transporter substrate-binding lipoprotein [Metamycoplasma equirhinis]|uniref:OppA family ABC transporter substrate-binding lipoprotein n=1 Tax=Metamycoplasma equirhinis TaxID=92402 RepID=UPI0035930E24